MRKILSLIITLAICITTANAESINKTLNSLGVNKSAVAISIKDIKDGNTIYEKNERAPMLPASTLKLVTSSASVNTLGKDFKYKTQLYKSTNNDLYIKLSADPLLTTSDLERMIEEAKTKNIAPKTFYIDDTAFDSIEWGEGWQWDDELNPLMQKFSIYNINRNLLRIEFSPTTMNNPASIKIKPFYPITFINEVITTNKNQTSVKISKNYDIAPNILSAAGRISNGVNITLPVPNPKTNFILRLEDSMRNKKFEYFAQIKNAKLPDSNIYLASETEHELTPMIEMIIKSSNNFVAETVFKTAGAVWSNKQGTAQNSIDMLNSYLTSNNLNTEDIKIVDGSGVSKNNIMTADFMSDFLVFKSTQDDFEEFKEILPAPGEGTLKNRMLYFKDNLRAKTGTLSDTSAIAGYLTTKRGKTYAFDIMINDAKTSTTDKKNIEEQILRNIYLNY
ncbi:D-alanyl-D-alanine carboxypeptidase/D-alanyl-D-alanine-endopeptidase [bacterium]|nr:D-alanyl-D-alanine carboxypeptidase/D-alanyl-D-alanine-endopeptidase [bacterium]